jgi:hypothetical protein
MLTASGSGKSASHLPFAAVADMADASRLRVGMF